MKLINDENELLQERIFIEKFNKHYNNFYDIKNKNKDNILIGAQQLKFIKDFGVKILKINDIKLLSADIIQNKINIVNENKDKFLDYENQEGEN